MVEFVMILSAAYLLFRKKTLIRQGHDGLMSELHAIPEVSFTTVLRIAHQFWDQLKLQGNMTLSPIRFARQVEGNMCFVIRE
jgi:hypothetical protein